MEAPAAGNPTTEKVNEGPDKAPTEIETKSNPTSAKLRVLWLAGAVDPDLSRETKKIIGFLNVTLGRSRDGSGKR